MAATTRQRCTVTGCNPILADLDAAAAHREQSGHRTAAWPVRSAEGKRRAKQRNRNGYYDKYNRAKDDRLATEFAEECRNEAINAMTPQDREQSQAADREHIRRLQDAHHEYLHGDRYFEDEHPFSDEALGQF